jgi:cGMP-dependent protein kinase
VPFYTPPEIIIGESYDLSADYWSLGVCIYELLCGGLPFGDQQQSPLEVYEEIIKAELKFPNFFD